MLTEHFSKDELRCKCCRRVRMNEDFMIALQQLRFFLGFPLLINSGYRCKQHNMMIGGAKYSKHVQGLAVDISTSGYSSDKLWNLFNGIFLTGFKGIGS